MLSKIKVFSLLVIGSLIVGFLAVGCGTQTPQIQTSSNQPSGLVIRGTVYALNQSGTIMDNPVAGVVLFLSGDSVSRTTTTNANGEYSFANLPSNNTGSGSQGYNIVATKEGYQRTMTNNLNFGSMVGSPVPDNSILTQDITLSNRPVVLSISPVPGTTIEAVAKTFTVVFDEAMDQSSVRPSLTCTGIRTFTIGDTQTLSATWSADSKIMYITTLGALASNQTYRLQIDPGTLAKDLAGNLLDTLVAAPINTNSGGLTNAIYNQTSANNYFRTASGGVPGAPTGLLVTVNGKTTIDYSDAISGGNVNLSWLAPSGLISISGYKVYASTSSTGPWYGFSTVYTTNIAIPTINSVNQLLYGPNAPYNADCIRELAFVTDPVYFKVIAFNGDGEGTGVVSSAFRDSVRPILFSNAYRNPAAPSLVAIMNTTGALPKYHTFVLPDVNPLQDKGCYLIFTEPMNLSNLTDASKYTIGAVAAASATIVYNSNGYTVVELTFTNPIATTGAVVTLSIAGVTDLSNNQLSDAAYTVPPPNTYNQAVIF